MRMLAVLSALLLLAGAGVMSEPVSAPASAQEATPCALWPQNDPGITSWEVGEFMQWPSHILVQFAPGASVEGDDGTMGAILVRLIYVQSGVFTLTSTVPMAIQRGAAELDGAPEIIAAGTEFTVEAGDSFLTGPVTPSMRNDGSEPATYQSAAMDPISPLVIDRCAPLG